MTKLKHFLRNAAKMATQNILLPLAYGVAALRHSKEKTLYVFADAHHTDMPFSLAAMHRQLVREGITPVCHFYDYTHEGYLKSLRHAISFMDLYAQAKYVFICDTFLPVSSGKKKSGTRVVQLCHYSGPLKKIGYATTDDIPSYYKGNVFANYDLVPVSSAMYVPLLQKAMRQQEGTVQALGVSRSDVFFDEDWCTACREEFYKQFPQASGKKVLLWAPTFRGKAASPDALANESFAGLQEKLGEDWLVLIKHHPHDDAVAEDPLYRSNCTIPTENLLPVVDLLITDYSTTVLDYLIFNHPFILYASDLEHYEKARGFFVDYRSITRNLITDTENLDKEVLRVYDEWLRGDRAEISKCRERFIEACDGNATKRILQVLRSMDRDKAADGKETENAAF